MNKIVIAVDGPAGAGKSTVAKKIADKLNILYIDTGAMYRAVTLNIIKNNIDLKDDESIQRLLENIEITLKGEKIYLNQKDVSKKIRSTEVNRLVSPVSAMPIVREKLVKLQRDMASLNSVIMDGRDIGTNVLKNADVKIYLTASIDERAKRRYLEMKEKGIAADLDLDAVKKDIIMRDKIDSERTLNPLKKAEDAIIVETTDKSIDEVVNEIIDIVNKEI
jgi:cytidylate kinase